MLMVTLVIRSLLSPGWSKLTQPWAWLLAAAYASLQLGLGGLTTFSTTTWSGTQPAIIISSHLVWAVLSILLVLMVLMVVVLMVVMVVVVVVVVVVLVVVVMVMVVVTGNFV